jgi:hypothetical protein
VFLFLFAIAFAIIRKDKRYAVFFALLAGLMVTVLLCPVILFRYCYPFIICMPLLLASLVDMGRKKTGAQNAGRFLKRFQVSRAAQ